MNTIAILWLRQIKRFSRSTPRIVGSLAQPVLYLFTLGFGFGAIFQKAGQGDYLAFLTPGVIGMSVIFTAMFSGIELIWDRQFGFLKETLVAPVSRVHIMLGRTLGGASVATFQGLIVLIIAFVAGFRPHTWIAVLPAVFVMFLVSLLFTALGTAVAARLTDMQGFQLIMNFLVMPLFFLSGSLFPLQGLPPILAVLARIDPLSYGIDALRGLLINSSHYGLYSDIAVLSGVTILFLSIGTILFSRIEI